VHDAVLGKTFIRYTQNQDIGKTNDFRECLGAMNSKGL